MRVDALAPAKLPDAGIGGQGRLRRLGAERLEQPEKSLVAGTRQPPVEEHRRRREDDAAIGVVLRLLGRRIADAHGSVATIALERLGGRLLERIGRHHAVDRPQHLVLIGGDREREGDEILHRLRRADLVERLDDEIGVAQPAIAVIPRAARAGRLGDRGGHRRDDAAGLVEGAELERDGGADHRLLPVIGDRQAAHPGHPVLARAIAELLDDMRELAGERLGGAADEMQRPGDDERRLAFDQRQRRVGGRTKDRGIVMVADMVAADGMALERLAIVVRRSHPDGDARQAGDRLDDAKQLGRAKHAAELLEARREIGDAHRIAVSVGQTRRYDRRIAQIFRAHLGEAVEHHVGESLLLVAGEQPGKQRIAIEARKAPPDDARRGIDERRRAPVADEREVETVVGHWATLSPTGAMRSSQARTRAGVAKWPATPPTARPTENAMPSSSVMMANTVSSVVSSPMKIGRRPANGACFISSRTPVALVKPGGLISITALPGRISTGADPRSPHSLATASRRVFSRSGAWRKCSATEKPLSSATTPAPASTASRRLSSASSWGDLRPFAPSRRRSSAPCPPTSARGSGARRS